MHTVCVQLGTCSSSGCGLAVDVNGLCVNSSIAGSGLTYNSGILNVNAVLGGAISAIPVKLNTSCCLVVNCADITGITVNNSLSLGGNLANTYALLAAPSFTTCITAPIACFSGCVRSPLISGTTICGSLSGTSNNANCLGSCLASCYQQKAGIITYTGTTAPNTYATLLAPISIKTGTTYTLQIVDSGKILEFTNTGTTNITLPSGATFSQGFQVVLTNVGGGNKCLVAGTGASIHTLCSHVIIAGAYNAVSVYYSSTNNWVAFGNLT